ncbi:MAG TPA: hypothetical protein VF911_01720 [Thermoanaerobaculia bacterium]
MRQRFILVLICFLMAIVDGGTLSGSLRRVYVKRASREAKELGLTVTVTRDQWYPDAPIITVTARDDGPFKSLFAAGLRLGKGNGLELKEMLLDVPLQPRRPYLRKPGLDFTIRVHDSMIASSTLYFRCGTPYSEVLYEIELKEYVSARAK